MAENEIEVTNDRQQSLSRISAQFTMFNERSVIVAINDLFLLFNHKPECRFMNIWTNSFQMFGWNWN